MRRLIFSDLFAATRHQTLTSPRHQKYNQQKFFCQRRKKLRNFSKSLKVVSVLKEFQNSKVTLLQQSNLCFRAFVHFHNCELFIVGVLLLSYSGFMFCSMHVGAFNMGGLGISSDSRQGQKNFGQKNLKNDFQRTQRRSNI